MSITLPVPAVDPLALHAAARNLAASLWSQPEQDFSLVGIGEAWAARPGGGPHRFRAASEAWAELLAGATIDAADGPRGAGPLLLGGFSFDDEPAASSVWRGFEPACLVLPSLLLTRTIEGAWLTLSWRVGSAPGPESLLRTWEGLVADAGVSRTTARADALHVVGRRPEVSAWGDSVARLAGAVGRGRLDKAVLARRVDLEAAEDIGVAGVLLGSLPRRPNRPSLPSRAARVPSSAPRLSASSASTVASC